MRKSYKAASSVGAVALVLSGSVMAAVTVAPGFDNWSVNAGTITSGTCASGYSCGTALSDVGFFQRMITSGGVTFFQTIITENDATAVATALDTLKFSDESFVRTGNVNGVSDKQRISETRFNNGVDNALGSTTFSAKTELKSGWAGFSLGLNQYLKDSFDGFQTDFLYAQLGDSSVSESNLTAKGMKITAYVPIKGADKQDFVLVDLQGDYVNKAVSSVTIPAAPPVAAQTMSWLNDTSPGDNLLVRGERIQAVYVGQDLSTIVGQVFGFTSYNNLTTGANDYISTFSLTSLAPVAWDTTVWESTNTTAPIAPWPALP